jgi:hypothetical protein
LPILHPANVNAIETNHEHCYSKGRARRVKGRVIVSQTPPVFPIAQISPKTIMSPAFGNRFELTMRGLTVQEVNVVIGFFNTMFGKFGSFRFESGDISYSKCRFDTDALETTRFGPDNCTISVPIKILEK